MDVGKLLMKVSDDLSRPHLDPIAAAPQRPAVTPFPAYLVIPVEARPGGLL
jgi:hypothetical protein